MTLHTRTIRDVSVRTNAEIAQEDYVRLRSLIADKEVAGSPVTDQERATLARLDVRRQEPESDIVVRIEDADGIGLMMNGRTIDEIKQNIRVRPYVDPEGAIFNTAVDEILRGAITKDQAVANASRVKNKEIELDDEASVASRITIRNVR